MEFHNIHNKFIYFRTFKNKLKISAVSEIPQKVILVV